jgi:hypothetical protein
MELVRMSMRLEFWDRGRSCGGDANRVRVVNGVGTPSLYRMSQTVMRTCSVRLRNLTGIFW